MPVMPRPKGKGTRIAFDILGVPAPMRNRRSKKNKVNERLVFEETYRVR